MNIPDPTICPPLQVKHRNKLAKIGLLIRVGTVDIVCKQPNMAEKTGCVNGLESYVADWI